MKNLTLRELITQLEIAEQTAGPTALVFCGDVQSGDRVLVSNVLTFPVEADRQRPHQSEQSWWPAKTGELVVEIYGVHYTTLANDGNQP